ncbi:MAG TPA: hypothetical protein VKV05_14655 [Terriglobales bacterium]|nr:hypothetical protein [Terriglobales bacterium]
MMTAFFFSTLLLLTIMAAFALGIAAGYWVIVAFLNLLNPNHTHKKQARAAALAPTTSGD